MALSCIGVGIDEINNCVFLEILSDDENSLNYFQSIYNSESALQLRSKKEPYRDSSDINAGIKDWLNNDNSGGAGTIGFCATSRNSAGVTESGFFTAGHCGELYEKMKIGSTLVGTVSSRSYGGEADVAFVNLDISSEYNMSNKLSGSYTISGSTNVGIVGTTYEFHGMSTGKVITGTVDNTSFSFTMSGVSFSNMVRMKMSIKLGDSGGPLVQAVSGSSSRKMVGILSGGDSTYSNFTKISVILDSFNATIY